MTSRREFTKALAALAATSPLFGPTARLLTQGRAAHLTRIGVQLYTLRDSMAHDVEGTLARVRQIGYREVEFAGYFNKQPRELRRMLAAHGLTSPGCHVGLDAITTNLDATIAAAHTIGHKWIVLPWIDDADRNTAGYDRIADQLNAAGEKAHRAGIRVAYHNHDFDLHPWVDGTVPLARLLSRLDRRYADIELDLYWVTKGGSDPKLWFERHPGRFPLVHVKDAGPAPEFKMADVGAGAIDWAGLFALRHRAGIQHYFIEHDEPVEPWASITASYRYLSRLSLR